MSGAVADAEQRAGETRPRLFLVLSPLKVGGKRHAVGDVTDLPGDVTEAALARLVAGAILVEVDPASIENTEGPEPHSRTPAAAPAGTVEGTPAPVPADQSTAVTDGANATAVKVTGGPPAPVDTSSKPPRKGGKAASKGAAG